MQQIGLRVSLVAGALIALVGCYTNNGGLIDLDGGTENLGPTPDGGTGGVDGGTGGTSTDGGSGGTGAGGRGGAGGAGGMGDGGSGGTGGDPLAGSWQPPVVIDSHEGTGLNPHVAIGPDGQAVAVWVQSYLGEYNVIANHFEPGSGWGQDDWIGQTDGDNVDLTKTAKPFVVMDASSVATAAWGDFTDPILRGIVSRRYETNGQWSGISEVYSGPSTAGDPRLSADAEGNVLAGFSTGTGAWASYFGASTGWSEAEIIDNEPNQPFDVGVALGPDGAGWAVWSQAPTGLLFDVYTNQFDSSTGWAGAIAIEDRTTGSALSPELAVAATGDALFVWQQTAGLQYQVWSSRWNASEQRLSNPVRLDSGTSATGPVVAMDDEGRGVAVWTQSAAAGPQIAGARFIPGEGWDDASVLAQGDIAGEPRVAMDSMGNAVVAYAQKVEDEDQYDAWARIWSGGRWSQPVRLGLDERTGDAFQPSTDMDPTGRAVVVWREGPDIWAASFE